MSYVYFNFKIFMIVFIYGISFSHRDMIRGLDNVILTAIIEVAISFLASEYDGPITGVLKVGLGAVPGLKKEEVKVELEERNVLLISGERSREHEEKNDKWHRVERSSGKFLRRFRLLDNAKVDQVRAAMENWVLTVTVPKAEEQKSQVKSIDICGA
ncbi:16.9 kDa class I heat shock protein 3-like [Argentina anserina]|uniref:16.9 kDa class I heat shock protein 3-like n=1 Tax=Argentina anserina TaxID=57926 RepID=UPI00217650E2|nr:16.9 kDa class I heat shock protein 3-like [Potentilla anserina]